MYEKKYILSLLMMLLSLQLFAEGDSIVSLRIEARASYHDNQIDGEELKECTGLKCDIVDVYLQGQINDKFSYKYRQRLNGINKDHSFFDATDWLYLAYQATPNWELQAGKWAVLMGVWEFDPAPIDIYYVSEFAYHFPCYEWGGHIAWNSTDKRDKIYLQVQESPFRKGYECRTGDNSNMWCYNLVWYGYHDVYDALWSVNMFEYEPGKYINYLCLGNRFHVTPKLSFDIDFANRATHHQRGFLFRDCSLMSRIDYQPVPQLKLFAKGSYDVNKSGNNRDNTLGDGTEITRIGAGLEYFPMKNDKVRIHANYSYSFGKNTTPCAVLHDKQSMLDIGLTWRMGIL